MHATKRRGAFTLIEVLIVVVIMAVLAATIIPQFSTSANDARESNVKFNLQSLRTQLELYKIQHGGYPTGTNDLEQLTKATDAAGAVSTTGQPDATHPFGPYVSGGALPSQPFSGISTVALNTGAAGTVPTATAAPGGGWIYRAATGEIWIDHPDHIDE